MGEQENLGQADSLMQSISERLVPGSTRWEIEVCESLPSTNIRLKELAEAGVPEGKVLIGMEQTAGRGRMGRSFFSPKGTGLYMSLLLRPSMRPEEATLLTPLAAVAVCEAIEELCRVGAQIKWVNDILVGGKKVCGILTEAAFQAGNRRTEYAVIGIGVNVFPPEGGFPPEIKGNAASLFQERRPGLLSNLAAEILNRLGLYYENFDAGTIVRHYRARSCVLGREITVTEGGRSYHALAKDIDERGALVVLTEDGVRKTLNAGEIKISI